MTAAGSSCPAVATTLHSEQLASDRLTQRSQSHLKAVSGEKKSRMLFLSARANKEEKIDGVGKRFGVDALFSLFFLNSFVFLNSHDRLAQYFSNARTY